MRRPLAQTSIRDALDSAVIAPTAGRCETPPPDAEAARRFMEFAARRRDREPVAYILGSKGFRSIELAVDPRVLIPRPETEHLVEALLGLPPGARVCDVGTGSGAEALAVARANAGRLGLDVEFHHGDLLADVAGPLDAVACNPPYVEDGAQLAPEIVGYEPALALRAGPSGLDVIRRLLPAVGATAAHTVALEIGAGQAGAIAELMREAGFPEVTKIADLAGH